MDFAAAIERIYQHLEDDAVEKAAMACLRIARASRDYVNAAIFMRELYPDKNEVARVLYDDMSQLKPEAQKFVWKTSLERWLEAHSLEFVLIPGDEDEDEGEKRNVLKVAIGEIDPEIEQWERSMADMTVPQGLLAFDAAAFTDKFNREKGQIRLRIKALQTIRGRVKTRCLNYAIQIERQLDMQRKGQGFLEAAQNEVNNYFKVRSDDVYMKLQKAGQLADSTDLEDASLLLTEVRRTLKAAADFFYPPVGKQICADGKERLLGDEQYLNRLHEFLALNFRSSTANELLDAELDHFAVFIRRLNDVASKGAHASVTLAEAKQGLVGLYFFLFNVTQRLSVAEAAE